MKYVMVLHILLLMLIVLIRVTPIPIAIILDSCLCLLVFLFTMPFTVMMAGLIKEQLKRFSIKLNSINMLNTSYLIGKVEPEVIDTLETMTSYLQQIPNIHQGGCAISALLMQEHLLNKHAIHADIIYTYECSKYSNSYLTNVKGLNSNNYKESATCEHAILDLCGYRFDAKRDYNFNYMLDEADVCELIMPTEFVLHSVNHALWSNIFDRRYIPQLLEYFDSKLPIQIKITIQTNN